MKNNKETGQINKKKSRNQFVCNEFLADMIYQTNLLPEGFEFDLLDEVKRNGFKEALNKWKLIIENELSPKLQDYIKSETLIRICDVNSIFISENPNRLSEIQSYDDFESFWDDANSFYTQAIEINYWEKLEDEKFEQFLFEASQHLSKNITQNFYFSAYTVFEQLFETQIILTTLVNINSVGKFERRTEALSLAVDSQRNWEQYSTLETVQNQKNYLLKDIRTTLTETVISVSKNGILNFHLPYYADALNGVDISRLRKCEVCNKFFWASRIDSFTCSKIHAETRKKRLQRKNWKSKGHSKKGGYLSNRSKKNKMEN